MIFCKVILTVIYFFIIISESQLFCYISGNEFVIQDLNFDTEYEVRVSAQNAIGFSNFTESLVQRTKGLVAETVVDGSSILSSTFNHSSKSYSFFHNSDLLLLIYILFATNEIFQTLRHLVSWSCYFKPLMRGVYLWFWLKINIYARVFNYSSPKSKVLNWRLNRTNSEFQILGAIQQFFFHEFQVCKNAFCKSVKGNACEKCHAFIEKNTTKMNCAIYYRLQELWIRIL